METTTTIIPAASPGASAENHDQLLEIMKSVIRDNPNIRQAGAVRLWLAELRAHEDYNIELRDAAERYAGANIFRRVINKEFEKEKARRTFSEKTERAKEAIAADIILWQWKLPTNGKKLCDCTFGEVSEAAPLAGKFLAKLSQLGAPGTLIREVFKNEKALKEFWLASQG